MFDWITVKERIYSNVSKTLKSGVPSFQEDEIKDAIELFKDFIIWNSGYHFLDGLSKHLLPSLNDAFVNRKGEPAPLENIATNLEPFVKKLLISALGRKYEEVKDKNLCGLLKELKINSDLSSQKSKHGYPQLTGEKLASYNNKPEYLYSICYAYITRNEVHNAKDLDDAEVLSALKQVLIVYIYIVLTNLSEIKSIEGLSKNREEIINNEFDNEQKMLFNFINYGDTSTEIKSQIVDAYILHSLFQKECVDIRTIISDSDIYFENSFSEQFYSIKIDKLIKKNKIEYVDTNKATVRLTNKEYENLMNGFINFNENKELFNQFYSDLLIKHNIEKSGKELLDNLYVFFENNFNIDICEIYCDVVDNINGNAVCSSLITYLKTITNSDHEAESLFKDILILCEENDFIVRICASKVFSKITDPDQFQNYLRQQKKIVYLDSQIILHALCCNYIGQDKYDNIFYRITDNLLAYVHDKPNIELRFANQYLSEIVYQLKLALFLIPFADNGDFADENLSTNIYYKFYYFLRTNNLLDSETNSFEEFMSEWLCLNEDDAYDSDYEKIAASALIDILTKDLHIQVEKLPFYEDWETASILLEEVIKENLLSIKTPYVLKNDAIMVCHLSNYQQHETEPFFLTWDKSFTPFRKKYKEKFRRNDVISWHLFTPSKFLNHMDLINFKIDPSSITNDFLSIIDGFGIHKMTRTIYDSMNRFLDIKNINKKQRHRYIKIAKEIFSESEFSYVVETPVEELKMKISDSFADILDKINTFLYNDSKLGIDKYRKMLLDEAHFIKIAELIKNHIMENIANDQRDQQQLFIEIDKNIAKFEKTEFERITNKMQ